MFKDIRAEAEEYIYKKLISQMDQFLELASYDWMLSEPQGEMSSSRLKTDRGRVFCCRAGLPVADGLDSVPQIHIREFHQPAQ